VAAKGGVIKSRRCHDRLRAAKVGPYRDTMEGEDRGDFEDRANPRQREGDHHRRLGFTVRREGIAQAIATVKLLVRL